MADINRSMKYVFELDDKDFIQKITSILSLFEGFNTESKSLDKSVAAISKSLQSMASSVLPQYRTLLSESNRSSQAFGKTQISNTSILKTLAEQAEVTGKKVREAMTFTGTNLSGSISASISALATALPAGIGAAIGGISGGAVDINVDTIIDTVQIRKDLKEELDKPFGIKGNTTKLLTDIQEAFDKKIFKLNAEIPLDELTKVVGWKSTQVPPAAIKPNKEAPTISPSQSMASSSFEQEGANVGKHIIEWLTGGVRKGVQGGSPEAEKVITGFATKRVKEIIGEIKSQADMPIEDLLQSIQAKVSSVVFASKDLIKQAQESASGIVQFETLFNNTLKDIKLQGVHQYKLRTDINKSGEMNVALLDKEGNLLRLIVDKNRIVNEKLYNLVQEAINSTFKTRAAEAALAKTTIPTASETLGARSSGRGFEVGFLGMTPQNFNIAMSGLKSAMKEFSEFARYSWNDIIVADTKRAWRGIVDFATWAVVNIKEQFNKIKDMPGLNVELFSMKGIKDKILSIGTAFKNVFKDTLASTRQFVNSMARRLLPIGTILGSIFSIYGVKKFANSLLEVAKNDELMKRRLGLLFHDMKVGAEVERNLTEYAIKTGVAMRDIENASEKLAVIARGDATVLQKIVKGAADIAATTGMTMETATENIIKMWEGGANASREFKNKGLLDMLGFQRGVELTTSETRKKLLEAFDNKAIKGNAETMSNTWSSIVGRMLNIWEVFQEDIMNAGLFQWIKAALDTVIGKITTLRENTVQWGDTTKDISNSVISVVKLIGRAFAVVATGIQGLRWSANVLKGTFAEIASVFTTMLDFVVSNLSKAMSQLLHLMRSVSEELGMDGLSGSLYMAELSILKIGSMLKDNSQYWDNVAEQSWETVDALTAQLTPLEEYDILMKDIEYKMSENVVQQEKLNQALKEQGKIQHDNQLVGTPLLRSQVSILKTELDKQQTLIEAYYAEGIEGLHRYFADRSTTLKQLYEAEKQLVEKQLEGEENLEKKQELYNQLEKLHADYTAETFKLDKEYYSKQGELMAMQAKAWAWYGDERRTEEEILLEAERKAIEDEYTRRLNMNEQQYTEELISYEEFMQRKASLQEQYELKMRNVEQKSFEMRLNNAKSVAGEMETAFGNMYEATGKKIKAFFYLQKAAAIVSTIITTYEGAQKAYTAMAGIPVVGPALGAAAAAIVVAGGLAKVALISSQNLAKGGEVQGYSPSDHADNIAANLTAGEYVQPVSTVKYYGPAVMEAIRRQAIPRENLAPYSVSAKRGYTHFASGGLVSEQKPDKEERKQEVNIVNITTQDQLDQYLNSKPGEQQIINVINRYQRQVKAIIAS